MNETSLGVGRYPQDRDQPNRPRYRPHGHATQKRVLIHCRTKHPRYRTPEYSPQASQCHLKTVLLRHLCTKHQHLQLQRPLEHER